MTQPMNPAAILFDSWAALGKGESMAKGHWPMTEQILKRMNLSGGLRCLDIGCGNGYAVREMARRVVPNGEAVGIDVAPLMIQEALAHPENPPNVDFRVSAAECLPFQSDTMDRVLSVEAIYYMADPLTALQEWRRVVRSGATVWLMVDFYQENPYCHSWADWVEIPMHLYTQQEYLSLLHKAGFKDVQMDRLFNPKPLTETDRAHFKPGWGYETVADVMDFRTRVGSLLVWGRK
jgi:ubiquinone/menaquinone biosynthesis C-methylase UbiE